MKRAVVIEDEASIDDEIPQGRDLYAPFVYRYAAYMVDGLIISFVLIPLIILVTAMGVKEDSLLLDLMILTVNYGYFIYMTKRRNATWGKKYFGLQVSVVDDKNLSWWKVIKRELIGKFISSLVFGLGYAWALFDGKKQTWHDKIAGTVVVQTGILSKGRKFIAYLLTIGLFGIAVLGILAALLLVAINPQKQLDKAREKYENQQNIKEQIPQDNPYPGKESPVKST